MYLYILSLKLVSNIKIGFQLCKQGYLLIETGYNFI
jgi:hypothetical protein